MRALDKATIQNAIDLRKQGMSYLKIARALGCSDVTIRKYCLEYEQAEAVKTAAPVTNTCHTCGEVLPVRAKFCYMCGTRILSDAERLLNDLHHMRKRAADALELDREKLVSALDKAIAYIEVKEADSDGN
jgi:hypothetical protein